MDYFFQNCSVVSSILHAQMLKHFYTLKYAPYEKKSRSFATCLIVDFEKIVAYGVISWLS